MEADVRSHLNFPSNTDSAYLDNNNNNNNTAGGGVNNSNMSFGLPTSRYLQPRKSNESSMSTISGNSNSSNENADMHVALGHASSSLSAAAEAAKSTLSVCFGGDTTTDTALYKLSHLALPDAIDEQDNRLSASSSDSSSSPSSYLVSSNNGNANSALFYSKNSPLSNAAPTPSGSSTAPSSINSPNMVMNQAAASGSADFLSIAQSIICSVCGDRATGKNLETLTISTSSR